MYKSVLRLAALAGLLSVGLWADSTTIDGASSLFGLWGFSAFGFGFSTPSPTPAPTPPPAPTPTTTIVSVAPIVTNTPPAGPTSTVTVDGSYSSDLLGTGLTYTTNGLTSSLTGNPVDLSSQSPFAYNGYLSSLPTGATLTDATLNLSLLIGAATGTVLTGSGTPNITGNLGTLTVTISAGGVTQTVTGTNLSSYDLFANGFESAILSGIPITLSFSAPDTVTGSVTGASSPSTGGGFGFGSYGFSSFLLPSTTTTTLSDTRTITASDLSNYLTLVYTNPETNDDPVVVPYTGPVDPVLGPLDDSPEPASMLLVGGGLGLIIYVRRKKLARTSSL
jgi:hypothetical protein